MKDLLFEVLTAVVYENFYILGYNTVSSGENQPTFLRNIHPSSGMKVCHAETIIQQAARRASLLFGFQFK
jgi:hypothetical protein